jgi:hypothetical protein
MGSSAEIETRMGGFVVHSVAQRSVGPLVNFNLLLNTKGSLSCSQESSPCPYSESD